MNYRLLEQKISEFGITKQELSKKVGVHYNTLSNKLNRTTPMDVDTLEKICKILKINIATLFDSQITVKENEMDFSNAKELHINIKENKLKIIK